MKLIVDGKTDKILGAGMVGPDAAEIIQGIAIALKAGATKKHFDSTVRILQFFEPRSYLHIVMFL